jgi:rhodanese-related sulfurtransferase
MEVIEREELKEKLKRGDDFKLVMTMTVWAYEAAHIPGSINISRPSQVTDHLSPDDEIVVYCTNPSCIASIYAYEALHKAGYKKLRRYSGGIQDWVESGEPFEGTTAEK